MKKILVTIMFGMVSVLLTASVASAHCEIPCGIYDDQLRIKQLAEHIGTVEKSMKMIVSLGQEKPVNNNQIVRWVTNKEDHANQIQHIVTQYYMTQRIKPSTDQYAEKLALLHKILIAAMKCKQTVDLSHITTLRSLLGKFEKSYFHPDK
jgi:nickel superoxide dismutase